MLDRDTVYTIAEIEDLKTKEIKTKADEARIAFFDRIYEADEADTEIEEAA
jgi:hypothetical protein